MKVGKLGIFYLLSLLVTQSLLGALNLPKRRGVLAQAQYLLEHWDLSYVYGGGKLGDPRVCDRCNDCLAKERPEKSQRISRCPVCQECSLDCSHFTFEVFRKAGLEATYLTTAMMRELAPDALRRSYHLVDIGARSQRALPGDLLVYPGHVVLLERRLADGRGDVIHVTSGRDLQGPGMGLQRERHVDIDSFRGPLQRILRHDALADELQALTWQGNRSEIRER